MKTYTKWHFGCVIVLCALLILAWIAYPKTQHIQTFTEKTIEIMTNLDSKPLTKRQPLHKEFTWQRTLSNGSLKLGFSYTRSRTGVRYVIGVPTAFRKGKTYLLQTLEQLIGKMNKHHRRQCLIIVFIGETEFRNVERIFLDINDLFGHYLDDGLISVISPPKNYYPRLDLVYLSAQAEQNLNYLFLMTYAQSRGDFYIQLEDNIKPNVGYMDYIDKFRRSHSNFHLKLQTWIVLSFSDLGFNGKLLQTQDLQPFIAFVKIFYNDQPIDWLLGSYVKIKNCRWDSFTLVYCDNYVNLYSISAPQSQFKHFALKSKKHKIYNKEFGRTQMNHLRQPLNLIMSHMNAMRVENKHLKNGETFIWGYMPQEFSLIGYMKAHQYDTGQIRIRGGARNVDKFSEVALDLLDEKMVLKKEDTEHCGFLMSYTHRAGVNKPEILYFYMSEKEGTSLFRRFSSGKACNLALSLALQMGILLWYILQII